jgi:FkbM family methyltransferase
VKLFLDVGAHLGQTLRAVVSPLFGFDNIVAFEPAAQCWPSLRKFRDPRITVLPLGLSNSTGERLLFDPGSIGASIFSERSRTARSQMARFVRASDWFRENVGVNDEVFMKLNCEGSECDILEDLLGSGEIWRIRSILVSFDIRKFPSERHREAELRAKLKRAGITTLVDARELSGPTRMRLIQRWLVAAGAAAGSPLTPSERLRVMWDWLQFSGGPAAAHRLRVGKLALRILPRGGYLRIRARLLGTHAEGRRPNRHSPRRPRER